MLVGSASRSACPLVSLSRMLGRIAANVTPTTERGAASLPSGRCCHRHRQAQATGASVHLMHSQACRVGTLTVQVQQLPLPDAPHS